MTDSLLEGLTIRGNPVRSLYPGWEAVSRHPVVEEMEVVLFRERESGYEACWWVSSDGAFRASHVLALEPVTRNDFLTALDPVFMPLAEHVLLGRPQEKEGRADFRDLPLTPVMEAAGAWISRYAPHLALLPPAQLKGEETLTRPHGVPITGQRLTRTLASKRTGDSLILASPFSGLPLRSQLTMQVGPMTAFRFYDDAKDAAFYLCWNEKNPDHPPSLYTPRGQVIVGDDPQTPLIPGRLLAWYAVTPDHAALIRSAPPFRAEDFGMGHASSARKSPQHSQPAAAASFLPELPPLPEAPAAKKKWKNRLKSLFNRSS